MRLKSTLTSLALFLALFASCAHHAVHPVGSGSAPVEHTATILFFSDAHADLDTHPELFWDAQGKTELVLAGGYARLAAAARAIRAETGGKAILVDGGDTLQGSGAAAWSQGEVVVRPQRALGVDIGIPGNWEVVYGAERLKSWSAALNYPLLAVNIVDDTTGKPLFAPYTVREVGGLRVGFVGYTDPDTGTRQSPSYSRGLHFLAESSLQPAIDALRTRERPDLVCLVTHVGLPKSVALADRLRGVDVILSGDTHERVYQPIVQNGIFVVEPGSFASFLGRLDVRKKPGRHAELTWTLLELKADRYPEDPEVRAVVDEALAPYRTR
jgi:2',3'-cyclic-nucleotide 2'-phosphodiesterase (5'-nucleotidase family)